jgi:hypothetical protein
VLRGVNHGIEFPRREEMSVSLIYVPDEPEALKGPVPFEIFIISSSQTQGGIVMFVCGAERKRERAYARSLDYRT